jgi:hypothetical protein
VYDWASLPYRAPTAPGWQNGLLIRRKIKKPKEFTFYLTRSPTGTPLAERVRGADTRWTVENCFETAKGAVGLDQDEVRSWTGGHRHITLALFALAYRAVRRKAAGGENHDRKPTSIALCGWTCCPPPYPNCAGCSGIWYGRARLTPSTSSLDPYGGGAINMRPPLPLETTSPSR